MERIYGGLSELPLREACIGKDRGTLHRALSDLFDERDELRDALRLLAHRVPWDGEGVLCWCEVAPFDKGSPKDWGHDVRCREIRELLE